ncbi:MAG: hypothetical protein U5K36_01535 [Roseovarius sp.]|nr:hypothetical protein [Roseovarius sp.]
MALIDKYHAAIVRAWTRLSLHTFTPDDAEWLIDQHAALYASDGGVRRHLGTLVRGIVEAFIAHHDPGSERGWIAWQGARRVGSIFCVRHDDTSAKLRLLPDHPRGAGHRAGPSAAGYLHGLRARLRLCPDAIVDP